MTPRPSAGWCQVGTAAAGQYQGNRAISEQSRMIIWLLVTFSGSLVRRCGGSRIWARTDSAA
jgi:hypothetical protein